MSIDELQAIYYDEDMDEERIGRTGEAWDSMAERFFEMHGWEKNHMAYDTDRGTGTLWVKTNGGESETWEDTGISARRADYLLTSGWDEAEYAGFIEWAEETHGVKILGDEQ